jgi:hypothetical protein
VKTGSLVRTNGHAHAKTYPKGVGVVTHYHDQGLHKRYNVVDVLWPDTGEHRSVREMFLEVVSESR